MSTTITNLPETSKVNGSDYLVLDQPDKTVKSTVSNFLTNIGVVAAGSDTPRTLADRFADEVNVKDFGAKGDAVTDDTVAIQAANDAATAVGATLFFPKGVYRCTDGIDKTCEWVGSGAAKIGAFPLTDDKVFMIPGIKNKLPGTCLLFTGVGTKSFSTNREDEFSSVRYCVLNKGRKGQGLTPFGKDLAIVCDFNYKNTLDGEVTDPTNDNSADYDVGLLMHNTDLSGPSNVTVGGISR